MKFVASSSPITEQKTECAILFCADKSLFPSGVQLDKIHNGILSQSLAQEDVGTAAGSRSLLSLPGSGSGTKRVLLVQLGKPLKGSNKSLFDEKTLVKVLSGLGVYLAKAHFKSAAIYFDDMQVQAEEKSSERHPDWIIAMLARRIELGSYRFSMKKPKDEKKPVFNKLLVNSENVTLAKSKKALSQGQALGKGINFTRELGNLPSNVCTPSYLAREATELAKKHSALNARSLTEKQMAKLGMHSLLSVSEGSAQEAKLIVLEYKGGDKSRPHVLVGKGVTFDTGGISLKPGSGMDEMKFDMCGAASVFGAIKALAEMQAKVNVVGIIGAVENMPGSRATRPGDIVKSMSGQTIEILNTDAEGRLVLCDALTYAARFKPKTLVDIATLTGACIVALGDQACALYANDQKLAGALLASGVRANDRAWQMPLWEGYQKQLDSNFADMANIGGPRAGSVTAACFLSRFTKDQRWAHLDIAGISHLSGAAKGATGRPVALLVDYLLHN